MNPTFEDVVEAYTFYIGNLLEAFAVEVEAIHPSQEHRIEFAFEALKHLRVAVTRTLPSLDNLEDLLAPFKEPVPEIKGGDFEADVLRDLANIDVPRHRPVSRAEARTWPTDWVRKQEWA